MLKEEGKKERKKRGRVAQGGRNIEIMNNTVLFIISMGRKGGRIEERKAGRMR